MDMNRMNIMFSRQQLRQIRAAAAKAGVHVPKNLTALKSSVGGWWLVEGDGFRKEVVAHNAFDAKYKVIAKLVDSVKVDE